MVENENENDGQIVKNDSGDVDGNSCCRATGDSSNGVDCAAEVLEEDKPDEADAPDELRPPKKTKCSTDDTCSVLVNDGVETTRHFLLEWLSYTCRYVPVGLLDVIPQRINWRPPSYFGRDDLETLMASDSAADWIRISEMLLGKVPSGFTFAPKHKSNAYDRAENG
ncbi:tRNA-dihydrouridine(47) synthase [NAD(P)(+)]-like [Sesamum angolense]|uniref:tRNA-dihydrouridine(47) synthase [NAD(P)(+)]-like n=1 Tax=Sesamum angolense TaxID=2727404 RepID=A0AAE1WXX4_9LAMI|nr:tRNA-dihydrouridine(47) synthase [NAD(P)(+)]-like [Sesamum angolense]